MSHSNNINTKEVSLKVTSPYYSFPSNILSNTKYVFKMYNIIVNYLLYMDDLKRFANNDKELIGLLTTVRQ